MDRTSQLIMARAMRVGLVDPAPEPLEVPAHAEAAVLDTVFRDRTATLFSAALASGDVVGPAGFVEQVDTVGRQQLATSVVAEAHAVRVARLFAAGDVRWMLTKGAAVSRSDYPDPAWRNFGDVDVVVAPGSWRDAIAVLQDAGYRRGAPEVASGFDERFGKGATMISPDELELDVHRRLAVGRYGVLSRMDDMFDSTDQLAMGGLSLPIPDPPRRLLHACIHAVLGGRAVHRAFRDVAQLLLVTDADWTETARLATAWQCEAVVARAIDTTWDRLELPPDHAAVDWARRRTPSRADARTLEVFEQQRPYRNKAWTAVSALPRRDVPAYLWALAQPSGRGRLGSAYEAVARRVRRLGGG